MKVKFRGTYCGENNKGPFTKKTRKKLKEKVKNEMNWKKIKKRKKKKHAKCLMRSVNTRLQLPVVCQVYINWVCIHSDFPESSYHLSVSIHMPLGRLKRNALLIAPQ